MQDLWCAQDQKGQSEMSKKIVSTLLTSDSPLIAAINEGVKVLSNMAFIEGAIIFRQFFSKFTKSRTE